MIKVKPCVSDDISTGRLGVDSENGVFELTIPNKVVLNWLVHLGLHPGDSDMVEEFSTDLHSKHLLLTEERQDLKHGAIADLDLATFSLPLLGKDSLVSFAFSSFKIPHD